MLAVPWPQVERDLALASVMLLVFTKVWFSAKYYRAYRKSNWENPAWGLMGSFFLLLAIGRIVYAYYDYYLTQLVFELKDDYVGWSKVAGTIQNGAMSLLILFLEHQQFHGKDKYVFFLGHVACVVAYILIPDILLAQLVMTVGQFFAAFIFFSLISVAVKASGIVRTKTLYVIAGFALFVIGSFVTNEVILRLFAGALADSRYLVHVISNAIKIPAVVFISKGYL